MYVSKEYQTSSRLQAIYALSNTKSKLFLSIQKRAPKDKWAWIFRQALASDIDRDEKTVTRNTDKLQDLGLIAKVRHSINPAHACAYKITSFGYEVLHIIKKIYTNNTYVFFSSCLLLSPVSTDVPRVSYNVYIKEVVSELSKSKLQTAPTRDPKNVSISPTTARKEVDVGSKEHKRMDIPEHIAHLTRILQLTAHGTLKLGIFDKETIDYAWDAVQQTTSCKDIFKELVDLCLQYDKDNGKKSDWPSYYDGIESGWATKKDSYTKVRITSAMLKPREVKEFVRTDSQSYTDYKNRDKSNDPERWIDKVVNENPDRHRAKAAEFLSMIENIRGQKAPEEVSSFLGQVEVVVSKPAEWNQTDKHLVDWALNYIGKMTVGKAFYAAFEQEILMGPDSPRARTGELQAGLKLMQRLSYQQMATPVTEPPERKVVTEIKDQIVCAQIANDDVVWAHMSYEPLDGNDIYEETC